MIWVSLKFLWISIFLFLISGICKGQFPPFGGIVLDDETNQAIPFSRILLLPQTKSIAADSTGRFWVQNATPRPEKLIIAAAGYQTDTFEFQPRRNLEIRLRPKQNQLADVVISGTLGEVQRMESTSQIEVYTPTLFKKSWNPSLLESVNMINGVQPQLNCNVCNTGDIHINGLEGPYTLVLIDGMPIVSSLSSVYGLSGIPQALIKRIEVVKGPASTLYGSEAMGGLINVITQDPVSAPIARVEMSGTSIGEFNLDLATKVKVGKHYSFLGVNAFNYSLSKDQNEDNFTDLALAKRISVFIKTDFFRKSNLKTSLAVRIYGENRWGGELNWTPKWKGGDSIYGESVLTNRFEVFGTHQFTNSLSVQSALNGHFQNSWYGKTSYIANQTTAFSQFLWTKKISDFSLLVGLPLRYTYYDDNSVATEDQQGGRVVNRPSETILPGIFAQADGRFGGGFSVLTGIRYDRHSVHGSILTPRIAVKKTWKEKSTLRLSAGTGYRVVNLYTEDHAALSGSREVVIKSDLKPEKSWNISLNFNQFILFKKGFAHADFGIFYTRFSNQIVGDFLSNPSQILYDNLKGFGISRGANATLDVKLESGFSVLLGATFMQVYRMRENPDGNLRKDQQLFAPNFSGTFSIGYRKPGSSWNFDLTGRVNGPMKLPVLVNDFRPEYSPVYALVNAQINKRFRGGFELFAGARNLLNFIPSNPLMRPFDPFNKRIDENNPLGYTFDTAYNFAPLQGTTGYAGIRWTWQ
ncbi:MAG TPA: TonB-dependent receptor [Catalimonadaceae bacterium]|nr:TonB-dependent receptor [Catalimonadaceae bacterium]